MKYLIERHVENEKSIKKIHLKQQDHGGSQNSINIETIYVIMYETHKTMVV